MTEEQVTAPEELNEQEQKLLDSYKATPRLPDKKHIFVLLSESGSLIAALAEDGDLTLGKDVTAEEAAKDFWEYIKEYKPSICSLPNSESDQVLRLKAQCFDLMQENKALKAKIATLV